MAWQDRLSNAFTGGASGAATGAAFSGNPWAIGGGAVLGAGLGAIQDTGQQEMARAMARGGIDPVAQQALSRALDREFDTLRRGQGQDFARRGIFESSVAGRSMGDLNEAQGFALAQGLAGHQFARQQLGAQMLAQQEFGQSQTVSGAINALTMAKLLHAKGGKSGMNLNDLLRQTTTLGMNAGTSRNMTGDTGLGGVRGQHGTGMNFGGNRNTASPKYPFGDYKPFMPPVGR